MRSRLWLRVPPTTGHRINPTRELKNLRKFHERQAVLQGALVVNGRVIAGKRVLLVDDLIRSGATLGAVAAALTEAGASIIYAFALTKTRRV